MAWLMGWENDENGDPDLIRTTISGTQLAHLRESMGFMDLLSADVALSGLHHIVVTIDAQAQIRVHHHCGITLRP
jgi:hypothetical protein